MAIVKVLMWPTVWSSYDTTGKLDEAGQIKAAKDQANATLSQLMSEHPGEKVTVAFGFAGFVPHDCPSKLDTIRSTAHG